MNGYVIDIEGYTFTPERVAIFPVLFLLGIFLALKRSLVIPSQSSILFFIWLLWALIVSFFSVDMFWGLRQWSLLALAVTYFFIIEQLNIDFFKKINSHWFDVLCITFGPFVVFVYVVTIFDFINLRSLSFINYVNDFRLKATFLEPNLFGAMLVPLIILYIAKYRYSVSWWFIFVCLNVALFLTLSRGPWIAYAISLGIFYLLIHKKQLSLIRLMNYFFVFFIFFIIIIMSIYFLVDILGEDNVFNRYHSILNRFVLYKIAFVNIMNNPVMGNGIYSFSKISADAIVVEGIQDGWIANIVLLIIHDTGLVGFMLFSAAFIVIIYRGIIITRRFIFINEQYSRLGAALLAGGCSLIVSGQSIPAISESVFWVFLAITVSFFKNNNTVNMYLVHKY